MSKQVVLTYDGLKKLEEELVHLKNVVRKEVAEKIKQALGFGDLSENSEYDEAKNEQAQVELRIVNLETMLKNARVIDEEDINTDIVGIGSKVRVLNLSNDKEINYSIVGSTEVNPMQFKISDESPVGKALIGKSVGDEAVGMSPGGGFRYRVLEINK